MCRASRPRTVRPAMTDLVDNRADERARLALQRMERTVVRARRAWPGRLADADLAALRYALGLARLVRITLADGRERTLAAAPIASLRDWLLNHLHDPLQRPGADEDRLATVVQAAPAVRARAAEARAALLARHGAELSPGRLDDEAAHRALVVVAGGGGGAGYVYAGAFACLAAAGLVPDYIVGNSMGAVLGLMRARRRAADLAEQVDFAAGLSRRDLFSRRRLQAEFGMPGLRLLHLAALHRRLSTGRGQRPVRLDECEIPLDVVVAGLRRQPYERLAPEILTPERRRTRLLPFSVRVASRLTRLLPFFRDDMVTPIVLTRGVHAVDAAGFSAAIPSILHYEPSLRAGTTREIFAELMRRHELAAIVDGGIADNVPARAAWRGVAAGRAGTRNGYYLAFDCFLPRIDPKNAWLWPITQTVQGQMRMNRVYADTMVRFRRTLSPVNLVPGRAGLEQAVAWGYQTMEDVLPEVRAMLAPVDIAAAGVAS